MVAYQPWSSTHTGLVLRVDAEWMKDRERTSEGGGDLHSVRGDRPLPARTVPPLLLVQPVRGLG